MRKHLVAIAVAVPLFAVGIANGETDEFSARLRAAQAVREAMDFEPTHLLRATRKANWEDDLFHLQEKVKGHFAKAVYFFEVTEDGYFILSPEEVVHVGSFDGYSRWTVAVARSDGEVIGLYGFSDPELGYQQLVRHSRLSVRSEADAESAALLFYTTVRDPTGRTTTFSSWQLWHLLSPA